MARPLITCLFGFDSQDQVRTQIRNMDELHILEETNSPSSFAKWPQHFGKEIDIVLVHLDQPEKLESITRLTSLLPHCNVIAIGQPDSHLIVSAMRSGCCQFVPIPVDQDDLRNAIKSSTPVGLDSSESKRVCVIGTSGGSGATTISCSLAAELGRWAGSSVIVDLDLEFGSVASAFDCTPTYTLANLCNGDEVDSHMIRAALAELPNNVSLLARPTELEQVYDVSPARLREVLDTLAEMFPYVVIDMSRLNGEVGRVALEHAHRVIIVTQSNVFSVRNASRVLETLHRAGVDPERVEAVINRAQSNGKRKKGKELASYVSCPVHTRVPNEYSRVQTSLDRGIIADMEKDSAVRLAIMEIAGRIAGISLEDRHARPGFLRKLLGLNKPRR